MTRSASHLKESAAYIESIFSNIQTRFAATFDKRDVNDAMGSKKKTVVITSDPLALIAEKTNSSNKKQEFVKSDDKKVEKKVDEKKRDMSRVKCYNCKKEEHFAKDYKKAKVKDYEYYKTKMLLAKKDKDEQVLLAEDQAWMESSSDTDQEINANMVFMAQIEKVLSDSEASSSSADEKIYECDKKENPKVIAPGMFKLNVSHCVSPISMSKSSCDSNNVEIKLKRKRRKRKSSKQNVKQVDSDVSRANSDFVHFLDLDIFDSVRRPKNSGVIWKKKGINDLLDDNNFFIFDDVNVRISPVSKMPFRKKPRDSMQVRSMSNMIKSLPRTIHKWLPKMQPLAEPICLWIIDSGCSKHMTGNRALLKNFVEKFLGTVRFGNNDFAVIAGYRDVIIGSMTIKKVYYVK
nr:integrase, catalytic region, zinc finger, CCHC-type, peptidase aspartic, catalytic [Tanacetum cinerariifolium]